MTTPTTRSADPSTDTARATDRAHTPLLTLLTQDALDSDYAVVSSRHPHLRHRRGRLSGGTLAALVAFGVLVAIGAVQTNEQADVASAGRTELIRRVEAQRDLLDQIQQEITGLRAENTEFTAQSRSLTAALTDLNNTGDRIGASAGLEAVSGPGVRVTIADAVDAGASAPGIVRDSDLRLAINALFEAGAEAVGVNGSRVSVRSAPRNSGTVIRLDGVSLSSPYTIAAIGDRDELAADFAQTSSGLEFLGIAQSLSMPVTIAAAASLDLPAAPARLGTLDHTRPITPDRPEEEGS
ncbi:hypothetical protein BH09ACT11_BH09ACT11_07300 [soil metagenome]